MITGSWKISWNGISSRYFPFRNSGTALVSGQDNKDTPAGAAKSAAAQGKEIYCGKSHTAGLSAGDMGCDTSRKRKNGCLACGADQAQKSLLETQNESEKTIGQKDGYCKKLNAILNKNKKRRVLILFFMVIIGALLETMSISMILLSGTGGGGTGGIFGKCADCRGQQQT